MFIRIVSFLIFSVAAIILYSNFVSEKETELTQFSVCMDEAIEANRIVDACEAALDQREWPTNEQFLLHLKLARAQLRQNNSNAAIHELNDALELNPDSIEGLVMRAFAADRIDDSEMSQADYANAIALDPNRVSTLMWRAKSNYARENYQKALDDFEQVLLLEPDNQIASTYSFRSNIKLEMYDEALLRLAEIIRIWPEVSKSYELQGRLRYHLGVGFQPTKTSFLALKQAAPDDPEVLFYLGASYLKFGDREVGEEYITRFAKAIEETSGVSESVFSNTIRDLGERVILGGGAEYLYRGIAYSWIGEVELALRDFREFESKGGNVARQIIEDLFAKYELINVTEDRPLGQAEFDEGLIRYMTFLDKQFSLEALRRSL